MSSPTTKAFRKENPGRTVKTVKGQMMDRTFSTKTCEFMAVPLTIKSNNKSIIVFQKTLIIEKINYFNIICNI